MRPTPGLRRVVPLALAVALLWSSTPPAEARELKWRALLDRAATAAEDTAYVGEALWVTYVDDEQHVSNFTVTSSGQGDISVNDPHGYTVRLAGDGSTLANHELGWFVPLPAADLSRAHKGLTRLEQKYDVSVGATDQLLDRPCRRVDIRRRSDGSLSERLWIDDESGLIVRRETYDGEDTLLRMVSYLRLDIEPEGRVSGNRANRGQRPSMERRSQEVAELDDEQRRVLNEAGWTLPDQLPGGYLLDGTFAVSAEGSEPLQVVYGDGLYSVSLFEQRGSPDWDALPPGAVQRSDLDYPVFEWPGAVPPRLVWEASGTTFSLVGDAAPAELDAMLAALPRPAPDGFLDRLRRGLGRLGSWVSPWH